MLNLEFCDKTQSEFWPSKDVNCVIWASCCAACEEDLKFEPRFPTHVLIHLHWTTVGKSQTRGVYRYRIFFCGVRVSIDVEMCVFCPLCAIPKAKAFNRQDPDQQEHAQIRTTRPMF